MKKILRNKDGQFCTAKEWFAENEGIYSFNAIIVAEYNYLSDFNFEQINKKYLEFKNTLETAKLFAHNVDISNTWEGAAFFINKNGDFSYHSEFEKIIEARIKNAKEVFELANRTEIECDDNQDD